MTSSELNLSMKETVLIAFTIGIALALAGFRAGFMFLLMVFIKINPNLKEYRRKVNDK
jgi:hypothetical protein